MSAVSADGLTPEQVAEALRVGVFRGVDGTWWERCSCCGRWSRSARLEEAARKAQAVPLPDGMEPATQ